MRSGLLILKPVGFRYVVSDHQTPRVGLVSMTARSPYPRGEGRTRGWEVVSGSLRRLRHRKCNLNSQMFSTYATRHLLVCSICTRTSDWLRCPRCQLLVRSFSVWGGFLQVEPFVRGVLPSSSRRLQCLQRVLQPLQLPRLIPLALLFNLWVGKPLSKHILAISYLTFTQS